MTYDVHTYNMFENWMQYTWSFSLISIDHCHCWVMRHVKLSFQAIDSCWYMFITAAGWQPHASWLLFFWGTLGPTLVCITECARYTRYIAFGLWLCAIWTVNKTQKKKRLNTCDDSIDLHVAHTSRKQVPLSLGASSPAPPAPVLLRRPSKEATAPAWKDCWCEGVGCLVTWWSLMCGCEDIVGDEVRWGILVWKLKD